MQRLQVIDHQSCISQMCPIFSQLKWTAGDRWVLRISWRTETSLYYLSHVCICKCYSKECAYDFKVNCSTHHNVILVGYHRVLLATLRNILDHGVLTPCELVGENSRTVSYIIAKGRNSVVLVKIHFRHNIWWKLIYLGSQHLVYFWLCGVP